VNLHCPDAGKLRFPADRSYDLASFRWRSALQTARSQAPAALCRGASDCNRRCPVDQGLRERRPVLAFVGRSDEG
jgi:hypothetical protein